MRIGPDPQHFAGSRSVSIPSKVDKIYFFPRKFQYAVQNTENDDTFDTDEKDKPL